LKQASPRGEDSGKPNVDSLNEKSTDKAYVERIQNVSVNVADVDIKGPDTSPKRKKDKEEPKKEKTAKDKEEKKKGKSRTGSKADKKGDSMTPAQRAKKH
jgi:hypothetical protein